MDEGSSNKLNGFGENVKIDGRVDLPIYVSFIVLLLAMRTLTVAQYLHDMPGRREFGQSVEWWSWGYFPKRDSFAEGPRPSMTVGPTSSKSSRGSLSVTTSTELSVGVHPGECD